MLTVVCVGKSPSELGFAQSIPLLFHFAAHLKGTAGNEHESGSWVFHILATLEQARNAALCAALAALDFLPTYPLANLNPVLQYGHREARYAAYYVLFGHQRSPTAAARHRATPLLSPQSPTVSKRRLRDNGYRPRLRRRAKRRLQPVTFTQN